MVFPAVNFPGTSRQAAHRDFITFKDSLSDTAVLLKELHEMKVPAVGKGMVSHIGKASRQLCLGKVKQPFKGMGPMDSSPSSAFIWYTVDFWKQDSPISLISPFR